MNTKNTMPCSERYPTGAPKLKKKTHRSKQKKLTTTP